MQKKKPLSTKATPKKNRSLISLLKRGGFVLPTTEEAIEEYDSIHIKTDIILPAEVDSPNFLFEKVIDKNNPKIIPFQTAQLTNHSMNEKKQSKNDYFKKLVLAAEIANELHLEPTFGHKKFVKLYYLCDQICNIKLSANYEKHVAGPLDHKQMYIVDAQFEKRKWFIVQKRKEGFGYKYLPGENIDQYKQYYPKYFYKEAKLISRIVELFRKKDSNFCEIVATMFYVWREAIINKAEIDNAVLLTKFYEWSEEKKKFKHQELLKAVEWMRKEEIVPVA